MWNNPGTISMVTSGELASIDWFVRSLVDVLGVAFRFCSVGVGWCCSGAITTS